MTSSETSNVNTTNQLNDSTLPDSVQSKKNLNSSRLYIVICVTFIVLFILSIGGYFLINNNSSSDSSENKSVQEIPAITGHQKKIDQPNTLLNLTDYKNMIDDGEIFLSIDGTLYVLNTNSMEMKEYMIENLQKFTDLNFSNDGQYLFANADDYVIIYHLASKKIVKIENDIQNIGPNPRVERGHLSSNNKYFIITTSCCPGDAGRGVFDFNGKLIKQLIGGSIIWSPDGSRFVMSKGEFALSALSYATIPKNNSIYLEEVSDTVTEKLLIKSSNQSSYVPIEWIDNTTLIYEQTIYSRPFPENPSNEQIHDEQFVKEWEEIFNNPKISYWKINIDNNTKEEIFSYTHDTDTASYSPSRRWKIVTEREDHQFVRYIVNDDNTIKIKLDVQDAVWKPTL